MSNFIPCIPDNAPFTAEQRAWLNGFLAGIFSEQKVEPAMEAKSPLRVAVLYASQSGTAEGLAKKLAKELKAQGYVPALATLAGYTCSALAQEEHALIVASTYGDGEAPDGVHPFYEQLCLEHFPKLERLSYSLLALGDSNYEHFCKFGRDLDAKLKALGANCIHPRVECDVDTDSPFAEWKEAVLARLADPAHRLSAPSGAPAVAVVEPMASERPPTVTQFNRENPLLAPVVDKRVLNPASTSKTTLHMAFSTAGTGLTYDAGDACAVMPRNDENLVAEILQQIKCNGNETVEHAKTGSTTLHDVLLRHLQITRLTKKTVGEFAARSQNAFLSELLQPERKEQLENYLHGRGVIDLLLEHPTDSLDANELVTMLPSLSPRLYSISSSPAAHRDQIHATVAVVRFTAHSRERGGVCSTLFEDRTMLEDRLPIYIQPNKKFRIPKDPDTPMIMIGPGTGIAPFRGFLHERRALGHKGKNWLFFGERSLATDFLYREELEAMLADKCLTRLDTAFSRDQQDKVYVQHRMLECAPTLWNWIEDGASLYVCGDAKHMARDVDAALRQVVMEQGKMDTESANEFIDNLKSNHRYHRDVY